MHGSTHLAGGLLAGVIINQLGISTEMPWMAGVAVAGVAALAPDWFQLNLPGLNNAVRGVAGHRGLSHWALTAAAVYMGIRMSIPWAAAYALGGWASHLVLDLCAGGMAVFWPWPGRWVLANIKTGGRADKLVGGALLALAVVVTIGRMING
jgi:membrane-bound metal-dependent hydrolase YbcI (DUF457 family)